MPTCKAGITFALYGYETDDYEKETTHYAGHNGITARLMRAKTPPLQLRRPQTLHKPTRTPEKSAFAASGNKAQCLINQSATGGFFISYILKEMLSAGNAQ